MHLLVEMANGRVNGDPSLRSLVSPSQILTAVTLKSSARVRSLSFRTKHAYGCVYLSGDHGTTILRKKQKKITAKYKCTGQVENYMDLAGKRVEERINIYFINDERLRKKNHAAKTPKVKQLLESS